MSDNPHVRDNPPVLAEGIDLLDGVAQEEDGAHAIPVLQAVRLARVTGDHEAKSISDDFPLPTDEGGTFFYRAGSGAATIDIPPSGRLKRVAVIATTGSSLTITIGGGDAIPVPAGGDFDERIPGRALGADVVISGSQAYYVSWVV